MRRTLTIYFKTEGVWKYTYVITSLALGTYLKEFKNILVCFKMLKYNARSPNATYWSPYNKTLSVIRIIVLGVFCEFK